MTALALGPLLPQRILGAQHAALSASSLPHNVADTPTRVLSIASPDAPFRLHNGETLSNCHIAYKTWGTLSPQGDNAILLFHALSGSHHAAGNDVDGPKGLPGQWPYLDELWTKDCQSGWWDNFIGPGKALDTRKHFVVCCNYLGGCYGSTGPASIEPGTESSEWPNGRPYGRRFPFPSIGDVVDSQVAVLDHLGIKTVRAAIGNSLGGFCVLNFAVRYPERVKLVVCVASGARATVLSKAMNFEQIYAIAEDARFRGGDYYTPTGDHAQTPWRGMALARMIAHKSFVSLRYLETRVRSEIIQPTDLLAGYQLEHQVESYLLHKGTAFVQRFDANAYLRIANMWQSFDLPAELGDGDLKKALEPCRDQRWLVMSIDSDVCFHPYEQLELVRALKANSIEHQYLTVHSEKGHDSFLLEPDLYAPQIRFNLHEV